MLSSILKKWAINNNGSSVGLKMINILTEFGVAVLDLLFWTIDLFDSLRELRGKLGEQYGLLDCDGLHELFNGLSWFTFKELYELAFDEIAFASWKQLNYTIPMVCNTLCIIHTQKKIFF